MSNTTLIIIGIGVGLVITAIVLPILLKWPWISLFLPWIFQIFKLFILVRFPITGVVDITVFLFVLLTIFLLVGLFLKKLVWDHRYTGLVCIHFALAAVFAISYSWTTSPEYGFRKLGLFAIFNIVAFALGVSTIRTLSDARKVVKGYAILALIISSSLIISPSYVYGSKWQLRDSFAEASALNVAYFLAIGAISSLIWLREKKWRLLAVVIWILGFVATYKTGSRAMMVQILFGTVMLCLFYRGSYRVVRSTVVLLFLMAGLAVALSFVGKIHSRIFDILEDPAYWIAKSERPYLWAAAIKGIPERPLFGHGIGAFAMNQKGVDARHFPHNFFLEVFYEGGLVSFVLFILFWGLLCYYLFFWHRWNRRYAVMGDQYIGDLWITIFVASGLAAGMHWDISGQRFLWLLAGIAVGTVRACSQETMLKWNDDQEYYSIEEQVEGEHGYEMAHLYD